MSEWERKYVKHSSTGSKWPHRANGLYKSVKVLTFSTVVKERRSGSAYNKIVIHIDLFVITYVCFVSINNTIMIILIILIQYLIIYIYNILHIEVHYNMHHER